MPFLGKINRMLAVSAAIVLLLAAAPLSAQEFGTLTGLVTNIETGQPVAGAAVEVPAANRHVFTNVDGRYLLRDVPVGTQNVRVSLLGYATLEREVEVTIGTTRVDFELATEALQLDALVVTGQQIERQRREVAYSVSTIQGEELSEVRETNFVNALAGRTPGMQVSSQSGDLGASTRIVIRGVSSLSGDNQPLFVVDGVPISNSNIVTGEATGTDNNARITGTIDVGNRAGDLNPDDIESVTVLRGAAAAALYGQRAKDGVILVTTKRGRSVGGSTITASTTWRTSSPLVLPDFQNQYAAGDFGVYDATDLDGWGPEISGQQVEDINGNMITLQAQPNNVRDFYESGLLAIHSVSLTGATDEADFRMGVTYQDQGGIIPGSGMERTSLTVNSGYQVLPTLSARLTGNYVTTGIEGKAVSGNNDAALVTGLTGLVNSLPRTMPISSLRDYKDDLGNQRPIGTFTNNPYWTVFENPFTQDVERFFGSGSVAWSPLDWVTVTGRAGLDTYTDDRQDIVSVGTLGNQDGLFEMDVVQERQVNYDLLAEGRRDLTSDISLRAVVGGNLNHREQQIQANDADNLTVPGLYNFANAASNSPANSYSQRKLYGIFGDLTFGFREYVFVNVTGRNDWSSTLPEANNSFFYPSVNVSFIPTEAFDLAGDVLSYVKLRANYARVGSDEAPYQLAFRFFPQSNIYGQYSTSNSFPYSGRTGFAATGTIPPADLKPQTQISREIGGEFQFYNGRVGLDLTYYDVDTEDQIISIPIPQSTGFSARRTNIGTVNNRGIEAAVNVTPLRTGLLTWDVNANYTANENTVKSLAPGVEEIVIASAFSGLQVKAEPGEGLGLYGPGFARSPDGEILIDEDTGLRRTGDVIRLGSIDPDFIVGLSNTLRVGPVTGSFLIDWREGGVIYSETVANVRGSGLAAETAVNRGGTFIDEGVNQVVTGTDTTYVPNETPVQSMQAFWGQYVGQTVHEGKVFDASNARVREVRLDWTVPGSWVERTPFGSLTVGVEGRNLWLFYKKVPHIDPEVGLFGSASNGQGIEWNNLPSVRSFGVNVQARF